MVFQLINSFRTATVAGYAMAKAIGARVLLACFLWGATVVDVGAQPVIQSFTPQSGPVGTTITIQGSGFSTLSTQNKVLVGGIATPVLAATAGSLTVQAPAGADWRNITVSVNGLTGYSRQPFVVTYPADYSRLDRSQFDADADLPVKGQTSCLATCDLNGDGRPELVMGIPARSGLLIHRNTSIQGGIQLQDTVFFTTHTGIRQLISADLNGDGWLDLASSHESERRIMIMINKGNGTVDFEPPVTIFTTDQPLYLAAADLNADGRTELVASSYADRQVVIYRNQGSGSSISYAVGGVLFSGGDCHQLAVQDVDGDGRTDLAVANRFQSSIAVFRNTSPAGGLSFAPPVQVGTGRSPRSLKLGDLDKDGKPDLLVAHSDDQNLSVMVNSSVPGSISFLPRNNIFTAFDLTEVDIADINGNGDLEAMVSSFGQRSIFCFRFSGSGSSLQAERFFAFRPGSLAPDSIQRAPLQYGFADLDADGKADLYSMNYQTLITTLVRNRINEPLILGFSPHYGGAGTRVTVKGARLQQVQSMQVGGVAPQFFQAINDSTIEMVVAGGNTGAVTASAATGRGALASFSFRVVVDSFAPMNGKPGQTITIYGKSFDPDPSKNLVTFGPVKAVVTAAQPTQLQVLVPPGASSGRIGVTVGGLTARSPQPFYVTRNLPANRFHTYSFEDTVTAPASRGDFTNRIRVADFNRDGRPDWISDGYELSLYLTFSVARNLSQPGKMAWAPIQTFTAYDASITNQMQFETGDIDGDGYDDIVASCMDSLLFVLRNISTPDSIAFAPPVRIPVMGKDLGEDLRLADLDGDGRIDIAVEGGYLFRNRSQPGTILFDAPFNVGPFGLNLKAVEDLDGDGMPELLSYYFSEQIHIHRNRSNQSGFRFEVQTVPVNSLSLNRENYFLADMDNDGRSDLVFGHGLPGFSVVRNTSSPGRPSFAGQQAFYADESWNGFPIEKGDVDGDGRLDVFVNGGTYVFRNTSAPGAISFDVVNNTRIRPPFESPNEGGLAAADLDLDGKTDLVAWRAIGQWAIHRNRVAEDIVLPVCPSGGTVEIPSDLVGNSYQWQVRTAPDQPFINLVPSAVYDSTSSKNLLLLNPPTSLYGHSYRCLVDGKPSSAITLKFEARWRSGLTGSWYFNYWNCNGYPDQYTDVIVEKGTLQVFGDIRCRSLLVYPGATVEIKPGATLQFN